MQSSVQFKIVITILEFWFILGRCRSSTIGRKWLSIDVATSGYDGWLMRWTKIYLSNGTVWSCYNTGRRWLDRPSCPKYSLICKC